MRHDTFSFFMQQPSSAEFLPNNDILDLNSIEQCKEGSMLAFEQETSTSTGFLSGLEPSSTSAFNAQPLAKQVVPTTMQEVDFFSVCHSEHIEDMIDKRTAIRFLTRLDENATYFTFQLFDDNSKRKNPSLVKILHGSVENLFSELSKYQQNGAGVFVTINETDGLGRTAKNISRVRAFFVDLDGSPLEPILGAPIEPHVVIESSPRRYHAYWFVEDCPLMRFSEIQGKLAVRFGGDPQVKDLSRVMRLPGFVHQKATPHLTTIFEERATISIPFREFEEKFCIKFPPASPLTTSDPILAVLQSRCMVKMKDTYPGSYTITCPWESTHSSTDDMGTKYYLPGYNGYTTPGFKCFHSHCNEKTISDLKQFLELPYNPSLNAVNRWEDPLPLPQGMPQVAGFDEKLLPDATKRWILDIADRMQIPPDFSAAASMVVMSSLIGRRCGIFPKAMDNWLVVPNLWGAIIGRPSLLKSPAISEVMKPLNRLVSASQDNFQNANDNYERMKLIKEAQKTFLKDGLKNEARKKGATTQSLDQFILSKQQEVDNQGPPIERRYRTEDGTVAKIGELLKQNPDGILIHRDELIGWLKSLDRYGHEGDRAFYLESWNGTGSFTVDRIERGTLHIPALCLSILGGIQPGPLSTYVYQAVSGGCGDDGLIQRFQMSVWPDVPSNWKNVDRWPDTNAQKRACLIFDRLTHLIVPNDERAEIPAIRFDDEGQEVFNDWRAQLENKVHLESLSPALESHLAKYRSLMPSIALILYLTDAVDRELPITKVGKEYALRAAMWCDYLETHAYRIYNTAQNPTMESARELLKHIQKGDVVDGFSTRDVYRKQWSKLTSPEEAQRAVDVLKEYGWIQPEKSTHSKSQLYYIHPSCKRTV